jgi:tetratricopeptide (TPR) repeat protein
MRLNHCRHFLIWPILLLLSACSTHKNTWLSRHFQELNTRYNIYFNAHEAYLSGSKQLRQSYVYDFSRPLTMFEVSNHTAAQGTSSNMNKAIDKCQKAIKKRSIRVKPAKRPTPKSKPSEKRFYEQEEFNPFMDEVFMLMAMAQFTKADFTSAAATCSYIVRHFPFNKLRCDAASILMARAYTELGWYYDAERVLDELNREDLTPSLVSDFSAANADLLVRKESYAEALPFLEIASRQARRKFDKERWTFLMGQLYQETNQRDKAYRIYSSIPGMNPTYEMELNARIRQTEVFPAVSIRKPLQKLNRMLRSRKNTNYLDLIYYAMGNLHMASNDSANAIKNYELALGKSTKANPQKLKTLLTLADFYFSGKNYLKAYPYYAQALPMMDKNDPFRSLVDLRERNLKTLVSHLKIIHDEDSLQALARMPELNRMNEIYRIIMEYRKSEENKTALANASTPDRMPSNDTEHGPAPSSDNNKSWYFYNPSALENGKRDFLRKWGNRALGDNWRTQLKSTTSQKNQTAESDTDAEKDSIPNRKETQKPSKDVAAAPLQAEQSSDPTQPAYYLKDIPLTETQLQASNKKIADALFQAGLSAWEQLEDDDLALNCFHRLEIDYPIDKKLDQTWFILYLIHKQNGNNSDAENARLRLQTNFPKSPYAIKLKSKNYLEEQLQMYRTQDTLYEHAFEAFNRQQTDNLFARIKLAYQKYPFTPLLPKFMFLEAMESARIGKADRFHEKLVQIRDSFPESDLQPKVKELLALWDQGRRPVPSAGYSYMASVADIQSKETTTQKDSAINAFKFLPEEAHFIVLVYDSAHIQVNRLQFDVALYNFTNYLVRDYELTLTNIGKMDVLLIGGFENAADVLRYRSYLQFQGVEPEKKYSGLKIIVASESNLKLLREGASLLRYDAFFKSHYESIKTIY